MVLIQKESNRNNELASHNRKNKLRNKIAAQSHCKIELRNSKTEF